MSTSKGGTPKYLSDCLLNAEIEFSREPEKTPAKRVAIYRAHIRDFVAQKFGPAYLMAEDEELKRLQMLFESLTAYEQPKCANDDK